MADRLSVRRIALRRAADRSFGSGWSFGWASMTKAELTAEKRPAYENNSTIVRERIPYDVRKLKWC